MSAKVLGFGWHLYNGTVFASISVGVCIQTGRLGVQSVEYSRDNSSATCAPYAAPELR
jgi:hypothetical protein